VFRLLQKRLPVPDAQSIPKVSMDSSFRFCAGGAGGASPGMSGMFLLCGLTIWETDKDRSCKIKIKKQHIMVSQKRQRSVHACNDNLNEVQDEMSRLPTFISQKLKRSLLVLKLLA
jgi:hypothetical protein